MMIDKCISCGMPMNGSKLRAGGKKDWCLYCGDASGKLKTKKEIREQMIAYFMDAKKQTRYRAQRYVDRHMRSLPAWGKKSSN